MTNRGGTLLIPLDGQLNESTFTHFAGAAPLGHCLRSMLEGSHTFDAVLVAAAEAHTVDARSVIAAEGLKNVRLVTAEGSGTRADCLRAGMQASSSNSSFTLVHDVSRPLASWTVRDRICDSLAAGSEFVIPTLVMVDSVKSVDQRGTVVRTVDRTRLRSSQFPRGIDSRTLTNALSEHDDTTEFDELAYALDKGLPITTVDGDPDGFEMRGPRDRAFAEAIVSCRLAGRR
ncbi:IspD/TarI family cytidylyltransferase [Rhodococcoides kyotonense]|uniref:2-C-methyl-D-erythritol 4-phosphate cytidylyltransferase n=1 Tax=Rhodococcoides kyotonense TaxID=398843 RepID=A0A239FL34_9NOCA|nr:2-C-methyl-D-erythritol 4-phosphate cytidylyltransferase [Rhodococcus kyotonensis]SNS57318.1 2-C-methyl-D-erythritol 4-phosphate cytidylyltransferase [Rhodococcus kyotonensis]